MPDRRPIISTYRLQLHAGFGFADARAAVPYLHRLGVSHLYLSPVLQAAPGSMHGYDVVDHGSVSRDLGGRSGLEQLAAAAQEHRMGLVVDVVPNHMALPSPLHLNRQLWETLRLGRAAPTADWFDIDWELLDGRVGLPVLGRPLDEAVAAGELVITSYGGQPVLGYHDQRLPLAPGSESGSLGEVLDRQHYRLAWWQDKDTTLGYRRFFDVDTLIAVRVELPQVFDATHRLLLELHDSGVIDGFRIDHPDGLADPQAYFEQLRAGTDGCWVVAEKILEGTERLPSSWAVAGTTGYDAARVVAQALAPPTGSDLDERWRACGGEPSLQTAAGAAKRFVIDSLFQPELGRLTRLAMQAAAETRQPVTALSSASAVTSNRAAGSAYAADQLREALTAILTEVEVYRHYVRPGHPADDGALAGLAAMVARAVDARPDLRVTCDELHRLLADVDTASPAGRELIVRFQQLCGPVMAKGIEDTTFYRWLRLVALNEVGGDPAALDHPSARPLHAWAAHQQQHHPAGLTTLSTHDTKRSEDVRTRLLAVAGDMTAWDDIWSAVRPLAANIGVDQPTAYLLMQTLVGAWPLDADRLTAYLHKAVREAKQHTNWTHPDLGYEAKVDELARRCLSDEEVTTAVESALEACAVSARRVTLAAKLLQLTLPGIPDVYQGGESLDLSLVDPDNRRPVDFDRRALRLTELDAGAAASGLAEEKLLVTSRVLRLRRDRPDALGTGSTYAPLTQLPDGLIGFIRGASVITLVQAQPAAAPTARVPLPAGRWHDQLSDAEHAGSCSVGAIFAQLPVALLVDDTGGR